MSRPRQCQLDGCDNKLESNQRKFCSDKHRNAYHNSRRTQLKAAAAARVRPTLPDDKPMAERAKFEVMKEELRPTIQQGLTDDVLAGLKELIQLTPEAVGAIREDLKSENDFLRQHAYQTLLKYTLGNNALIPSMDADKQPLTVVIEGLDRPTREEISSPLQKQSSAAEIEEGLQDSADSGLEYRICDSCGTPKPVSEFMGNSNRCATCFDRIRNSAASAVS